MELDLTPLTPNEIAVHELAIVRSKTYLVAESELLKSVIDIDESRLYAKMGMRSCNQYCVKFLNLTEQVAYAFIGIARKSKEVVELKEAIDQGDLTVSKAIRVVSVLTPENQQEWLGKAKDLTKNEVEKEIAKLRPERPKPPKIKPVAENRTRYTFEVDDAGHQQIKRAQELLHKHDIAEAFVEMAKLVTLKKDPVARADRAEQKGYARAKRKAIPKKILHQVHRRDRGCCQTTMPGGETCLSKDWVEIHHIQPKSEGGSDELKNLVTICHAHHRQVHMHG